jgi:rhodanese-related sulfurtransferase
VQQSILLIAPEGREEEAVTRLARVGFDNVLGYLDGGLEAWKKADKETDQIDQVTVEELKDVLPNGEVFDLRKKGEYESEHLEDVKHTALDYINEHLQEYPKDDPFYVHCAGGYRSLIGASILKSRGYHNVIDVIGGFDAIKESDLPVTDYICQSEKSNS